MVSEERHPQEEESPTGRVRSWQVKRDHLGLGRAEERNRLNQEPLSLEDRNLHLQQLAELEEHRSSGWPPLIEQKEISPQD